MRNIFVLLLLFAFTTVNAQKAVIDGRSWEYNVNKLSNKWKIRFTINGDTIFDGTSCKKMYYSDSTQTLLSGYIYETDNHDIYIYNVLPDEVLELNVFMHKTGWQKTTSFGLSVGDNVPSMLFHGDSYSSNNYKVYSEDEITVKGRKYKRWLVSDFYDRYRSYVVEGIGNNRYGIFCYIHDYPAGLPHYGIAAVYDGEECIFESKDFTINTEKAVVEGRSWNYSCGPFNDRRTVSFTVGTDTVFEKTKCKKLLFTDNGVTTLGGYIYETSDNKVFIYNLVEIEHGYMLHHDGWKMTQNFSMIMDDAILDIDNKYKYRVEKIDTICVKGKKLRRWHSLVDKENPDVSAIRVVEGIGSNNSGIFRYFSEQAIPESYPYMIFLSCYDGDECIFESKDFYADAITNNINTVKHTSNNPTKSIFFDLQGRKVQNPTKGVYIKDGKKVVVK